MPVGCFCRFISQNKQLFFRYSVPFSWSVKLGRRLFLNYELNCYVLLTWMTFLRRGRVVLKKPLNLSCPFAHLSACISAAPFGRISLQFYSADFYENLSRKKQILLKSDKIWRTLHEDLSTFYCCSLRVKWYQAVRIAEGIKILL